jgi:hypothetical protein
MYIISKKKDYYDGVVGTMGVDKSIVYVRDTKILENHPEYPKEFQPAKTYNIRYKNHFLNLSHYSCQEKSKYTENSTFIVGFCGKIYIGWKLYYEEKKVGHYTDTELITDISYDYNLVKKHIKTILWHLNLEDDINYIKSYNPIDIFRILNAPIFIYDADYNKTSLYQRGHRVKNVFIINPNLSDYEFFSVVDSFTAFQEIQMFMGGVLGMGEKEIIEVADKYKIGQHGFNKWSFRREPENKK